MQSRANKKQQHRSPAAASMATQQLRAGAANAQLEDKRPAAVAQQALPLTANNSALAMQQKALQDMANSRPQARHAAQLQTMLDNHGALPQPMQGSRPGLPPEARQVMQQKQGGARPVAQLRPNTVVNDDASPETAADVMGKSALAALPDGPIQLKKYIRVGDVVRKVKTSYTLKSTEVVASKKEYLEYLAKTHGPIKGRKSFAPTVQGVAPTVRKGKKSADNRALQDMDLNYRGMSVNNISNLQKNNAAVFTVNNPAGTASADDHIVNDDLNSPYLSFEKGGLEISAGKYAPKPVDEHNAPLGVKTLEGGFLKQDKSYTKDSQELHADRQHIGLVAGVVPMKSDEDYSTPDKADALKSEKARILAVADREVLVKPGAKGIGRSDVPFLARVKRVPKEYYIRHIQNQTTNKALGFYDGLHYKIQMDKRSNENYRFAFKIPPVLTRAADESDDEMSDIEEIGMPPKKPGAAQDRLPLEEKSGASPAGRTQSPAERMRAELRAHIAGSRPQQQLLGAQDASVDDLRAMQNEALASNNASKSGDKKGNGAADESNWTIVDYGGGGNCLFLALGASRDVAAAHILRTQIAEYQRANNTIGQGIVDNQLGTMLAQSPHAELYGLAATTRGRQDIPVAAYHSLMAFEGTWGGRSEIATFCVLRHATVYVLEHTGSITQYAAGHSAEIATLPADVFNGVNIVLYKTNNHWRRVTGRRQAEVH